MRPVHFEIPAENTERAMKFFGDVFGWNFQGYGDGYFMATTGDGMGINGAIYQRQKENDGVVNSIGVPSIDDYITKIETAGGTVVLEKIEIGENGWYATFQDTEGNVHGLWQSNVALSNDADASSEDDDNDGNDAEETDADDASADEHDADETEAEELDSDENDESDEEGDDEGDEEGDESDEESEEEELVAEEQK